MLELGATAVVVGAAITRPLGNREAFRERNKAPLRRLTAAP